MNRTEEARLVEEAKAGDEAAFRKLVESNMQRIYGLALRYTYRHEDADEIAQETFIKAFKALKTFRGDSVFSTWIYRIGINCCLTFKRSQRPDANPDRVDELDESRFEADQASQERLVQSKQTREMVRNAMGVLSKQQRAVFVLKYLQHKKISEIATMLECAEGTVKQQLFRAVRKVREELAPVLDISMVTK